MSSGPAAVPPPSTLDDDAWDDLLSFIEERRVVPIVGPGLLQVSTGSNFTYRLARLFLRMAKCQRHSDPRVSASMERGAH